MRKVIKLTFLLTTFLWILSCGQNHHITSSESNLIPLNSEVDISVGLIVPDGGATLNLPNNMGTCSPNGLQVIVSSNQMSPNESTCYCIGNQIDCSTAPESPFLFGSTDYILSAKISNGIGGFVNDSNPSNNPTQKILPTVSISSSSTGNLSLNEIIPITGSCSSDGSAITITSSSPSYFSQASLSCTCGNSGTGQYDCGDFTITNYIESDVEFTASITDIDGDREATTPKLDVECTTEDLNSSGGTLASGTTYTTNFLDNGSFTALLGGDWRWSRNPHSDLEVSFSEKVLVFIKPQQALTANSFVWQNSQSGFPDPTSFCVDTAFDELIISHSAIHPIGSPAAVITGNCANGNKQGIRAVHDWGEIKASNIDTFTFRSQFADGYNFSALTCTVK